MKMFDRDVYRGIQYTKVKDNFASILNTDGKRIAFEFAKLDDQSKVEAVLRPLNDPNKAASDFSSFLGHVNEGRNVLYFLCVLINRQEKTVLLPLICRRQEAP